MRRVNIQILKENANLTVGELLTKLEEEQIAIQQKEDKEFNDIKAEYNNVFLKGFSDSPIFGRTLEVLHVKQITSRERTTEWDYIYYYKGNRISFSKRDIYMGQITNTRFIEELNGYEKISQEEYRKFMYKYQQLQMELNKLIAEDK